MTHGRLFLVMLALLVGACRKQPKPPDRTAPWLASAAPSASARPELRRLTYVLGPSRVELELPARRANPKGRFSHATGELDVDLDDLSHTTGGVSLDLTTIELTGSDGLVDAPNTAHALDWLELGAGVPAERRDTLRQVAFTVSSLDAGHLVAAPSGERPTRRRELVSNWTLKGELSLHGVRAPMTAEVTLIIVPGPDPAGPPAELLIRSKRPLVIALSTHDIRPREGHGAPVAKDQGMLGESVGREAHVTFELTFMPRR